MYGPAPAMPPRRRRDGRAGQVVVWVVLAVVSLGSIGFLSWVPPLVLAIRTRRTRDWVCCAAAVVLCVAATALVAASDSDDDWQINTGVALLLLLAFAAPAHYLTTDLRRADRPVPPPAVNPYTLPYAATGTPSPTAPVAPAPVAHPTAPLVPAPVPPVVMPYPAPGASSGRIEQVRAELDELSAYLRQQDPSS